MPPRPRRSLWRHCGGLAILLHRPGYCGLPESDSGAGSRPRLCLPGLLLCLLHLDWPGHCGSSLPAGALHEFASPAPAGPDCRLGGARHPLADALPDCRRPRPLPPHRYTRHGLQSPHRLAPQCHHVCERRQRHFPALVYARGGGCAPRCQGYLPALPLADHLYRQSILVGAQFRAASPHGAACRPGCGPI